MTKELILCGGNAQRFWPLSDVTEKSLLTALDGKPIIRGIVDRLIAPESPFSEREIVICCSQRHLKAFEHEFRDVDLNFSPSEVQLGTMGHMVKAIEEYPDDVVLVHYADMISDIDYSRLNIFHENLCTIVSTTVKSEYGVVDAKGRRVINFLEKPAVNTPTFTGVMMLTLNRKIRDILTNINALYQDPDISKHLIPELVSKGMVDCYNHKGFWKDLGTLSAYIKYISP